MCCSFTYCSLRVSRARSERVRRDWSKAASFYISRHFIFQSPNRKFDRETGCKQSTLDYKAVYSRHVDCFCTTVGGAGWRTAPDRLWTTQDWKPDLQRKDRGEKRGWLWSKFITSFSFTTWMKNKGLRASFPGVLYLATSLCAAVSRSLRNISLSLSKCHLVF